MAIQNMHRESAIIFSCMLACLMIFTLTGPVKLTEHVISGVAALANYGPAPEGFINVETCVDPVGTVISQQDNKETFQPIQCNELAVQAFSISDISEKVTKLLLLLYIITVGLGLFVTGLPSRVKRQKHRMELEPSKVIASSKSPLL